jgi:hypothetical protein
VAIAGIWTRDIVSAQQLDTAEGRLRARDPQAGTVMLPHWIAEYATAAALLAGSAGLLIGTGWGKPLGMVALGALVYTSINSLGWVLADRIRTPYGVPMAAGAIGGLAGIIVLFVA